MNIGIAGSGPSAVYAIKHLLAAHQPLEITVYEAGDLAGVGTPYDPRTTPVSMLANIASVELPPVTETLQAFLSRSDDRLLESVGVDRATMTDRTFHPRIAIGAYFAAQIEALRSLAASRGHRLTVQTGWRVVDIWPDATGARMKAMRTGGQPAEAHHDRFILATGHSLPRAGSFACPDLLRDAGSGSTFGILGSSLSAIDIVVALATSRGRFTDTGYELDESREPFTVTMMSRGGRLPEADFYCPLPAAPLPGFTQQDVETLACRAGPGRALDMVFARFAFLLAAEDPDYAARIGLSNLTADTFASAYFRDRDGVHPLVWARRNLDETIQNAKAGVTVPWRYTILRCHEAFAACLPHLDEDEIARFERGMKKVFIDNYAAVPPQSIARLLALHDAGMFDVLQLGSDYAIDVAGDQRATVTFGASSIAFDRIYDARGQASADADDLPFPTLRFLLSSNHRYDTEDVDHAAVAVDGHYRLSGGLNPLPNIWCLSLPFLLSREPFIQGLTSAAKLGKIVADSILADADRADEHSPLSLRDLVTIVHQTDPVVLNGDLVVLTPKAA